MRLSFLFLGLAIKLLFLLAATADTTKFIVGATEEVFVGDDNLKFTARVDTGAKTSSIHASNIEADPIPDSVGKPIIFNIVSRNRQSTTINTIVDSIITIRTSEGSEQRYKVWLTVSWKDITKNILFTLNDRSDMQYALLLGRNWLQGDFVVDVDKNNMD